MIKKILRNIAKRFGQEVHSSFDVLKGLEYTQLLEKFILNKAAAFKLNEGLSIVIFSKDRALQLDALLRSFYYYSNTGAEIKVLYQCSSVDFELAYSKLINDYKDEQIVFIKESEFKADLISIFEQLKNSKVLFLVDDILFKNQFDLNQFRKIDPRKYIASLRHGKHLTYCYTLDKNQALPQFTPDSPFPEFLSWNWNQAEHDWAYPLSLDGHLFDTIEMRTLLNKLDYKAPNSLEHALQIMNPLFMQRPGLCFNESIIVNNPCNKVQTENDNIHGGMEIEDLNEKWLKGYKINFQEFEGLLNKSAHQDLTYTFVKDE